MTIDIFIHIVLIACIISTLFVIHSLRERINTLHGWVKATSELQLIMGNHIYGTERIEQGEIESKS